MASLKEGHFDLDKAHKELLEILETRWFNSWEAFQLQNKIRKLLTEINKSGYERGYTDALDEFLPETNENKESKND